VTSPAGQILCVEDDTTAYELVSWILKDYQVIHVRTRADALQLISEHEFDAMILDYRLPDGNGVEICEFARQNDISVPILLITGDARLREARALKAGAQGLLRKGLDLANNLESAIKRQLDR
jgi:two-component system, NtrC family, response regulator HydG